MSDSEKLKDCPFCGGKAEMRHIDEGENEGADFIQCAQCEASTNLQFSIKDDGRPWLIERWNRRAALAATSDGFASATIKARLDEYEFVCQMAYEIKRMDWYKRRIDYLNALLTSQEKERMDWYKRRIDYLNALLTPQEKEQP